MLSCKEASVLIIKKEEGKLAMGDRLRLFFHLMACDICKLFNKQSLFLSGQFSRFVAAAKLSAGDKQKMEEAINNYRQDH